MYVDYDSGFSKFVFVDSRVFRFRDRLYLFTGQSIALGLSVITCNWKATINKLAKRFSKVKRTGSSLEFGILLVHDRHS